MASAGPYASLHLAPDRQPRLHPPSDFHRPDALPARQTVANIAAERNLSVSK